VTVPFRMVNYGYRPRFYVPVSSYGYRPDFSPFLLGVPRPWPGLRTAQAARGLE